MLRAAILAALTIASLAAPAGASASSEWSLVFEGQGLLDAEAYIEYDTGGTLSQPSHADFSWRTELTGVTFDDAGRLVSAGTGTTTPAGRGSWSSTSVTSEGKTSTSACPLGGAVATRWDYEPSLRGNAALAGPGETEALVLLPFTSLTIDVPCTGSNWPHALTWPLTSAVKEPENNAFAAIFTLPKEALAQGKVIQRVESFSPRFLASCAHPVYRVCSGRWWGEVTLTRTTYAPPAPTPDDGVVPLPPPLPGKAPTPTPAPAPKPATPPAADPFEDLVPLVPAQSARATATGASVEVTCTAACSGSVTAFAARAARATAAAAKPLGSRRFRVAAGRRARVAVPFRSAAARRAVRRAGAVRLVVRVGGTRRVVVARARRG